MGLFNFLQGKLQSNTGSFFSGPRIPQRPAELGKQYKSPNLKDCPRALLDEPQTNPKWQVPVPS